MKWRSPFAVAVLVMLPTAMLTTRPRVGLSVPPPEQYGIEDLWRACI